MKRILAALTLIVIASVVYADVLPKDGNHTYMQFPAFNGALTTALTASTGTHTNFDLSQSLFYSVYCAAASKERTMYGNYSTANKSGYVASTIPATTWHTQAVNKITPFLNVSGCVGFLRKQ